MNGKENNYIKLYYYLNSEEQEEIIKDNIDIKDLINYKNLLKIEVVKDSKKRNIYLGRRRNINENKSNDFIRNLELDYLKRNNINSAIFCDCGRIITNINDKDLTFDELILKYINDNKNKIFINLDEFINELELFFYNKNYEVTKTIVETYEPINEKIEIDNDLIILRNYQIYLDNYLECNIYGFVNYNKLGKDDKDSYIKLDFLEEQIKPLVKEHIDLKHFINNYKLKIYKERKENNTKGYK